MQLSQRVVLITGAGSGIGRATALLAASRGASVVLAGRRIVALQAVCDEIRSTGGRAEIAPGDLCQPGVAEAAVETARRAFGGLHGVVANAGAPADGRPLHEIDDATWAAGIDGNLGLTFRVLRAALPVLANQGGGSVVCVSSLAGLKGLPGHGAYTAAKGAIVALSRMVAVEYSLSNIRCNCVCPGTVETEMLGGTLADPEQRAALAQSNPLGRIGQPEEIAALIVHLLSAEAGFTTGAVFSADGGAGAW